MNANPTNRQIQDALLLVTQALPAQNTTAASTGSIDTGQTTQFMANEKYDVQLAVPATPSLANAQTITFTLQDSADNVTFAPIAGLATLVLTGAGGVGAAAAALVVRFAGTVRRFINVTVTTSATAGNNTAVSYTFQLLF